MGVCVMRNFRHVSKALIVGGLALVLSGCVTVGGGSSRRAMPDEVLAGVAYGSSYRSYITGRDERQMSRAFRVAMDSPVGADATWRTRRTGSRGEITGGEAYLLNVDYARGRRLIAPIGLYTNYPLEPAQGDYQLSSNTNVRLGASTSSPIADTLDEGTVVEAAGQVRGRDWMLMARDGIIIGYMYSPLLELREGGDMLLAGGSARTPTYCRSYSQSLFLSNGIDDRWTGAACRNTRGRWYIEGVAGAGS